MGRGGDGAGPDAPTHLGQQERIRLLVYLLAVLVQPLRERQRRPAEQDAAVAGQRAAMVGGGSDGEQAAGAAEQRGKRLSGAPRNPGAFLVTVGREHHLDALPFVAIAARAGLSLLCGPEVRWARLCKPL